MTLQRETALSSSSRFYGWFALTGVMLVIFTIGGVFINTFGVFLPVVSGDFGWSRGSLSLALSMGVMAFGLPSPLFGVLVTRLGPRRAIILGNLLAVIGLACLAFVQEIWHVYLLFICIGFSAGFGGFIAATAVVANWFIKKRPLAFGLFTAFGGLGGFVFPPLSAWLIDVLDWRLAYVALAAIAGFLGVFIGGFVLTRNRPEDKHQLPDGAPPDLYTDIKKKENPAPASEVPIGNVVRQLLTSPVIWFVGGFAGINTFAMGVIMTHQVSYIQDLGYSAITAATTMSVLSGLIFVGSLTFGTMAMKINMRFLALGGFLVMLLAMALLITSRNITLLYLYAAMIGLGNGALTTAMPTFISNHFHGAAYSQAFGIILPIQVVCQSLGAYVAGVVFDTTASYLIAFYLVAGLIALGTVLVGFSRVAKATRR